MHVTDLQGVLTKLHEALDEVVLCLSLQLQDSLSACG